MFNGHIHKLSLVIFHSYVKLPEGNQAFCWGTGMPWTKRNGDNWRQHQDLWGSYAGLCHGDSIIPRIFVRFSPRDVYRVVKNDEFRFLKSFEDRWLNLPEKRVYSTLSDWSYPLRQCEYNDQSILILLRDCQSYRRNFEPLPENRGEHGPLEWLIIVFSCLLTIWRYLLHPIQTSLNVPINK